VAKKSGGILAMLGLGGKKKTTKKRSTKRKKTLTTRAKAVKAGKVKRSASGRFK
jgi:hypothetical protein